VSGGVLVLPSPVSCQVLSFNLQLTPIQFTQDLSHIIVHIWVPKGYAILKDEEDTIINEELLYNEDIEGPINGDVPKPAVEESELLIPDLWIWPKVFKIWKMIRNSSIIKEDLNNRFFWCCSKFDTASLKQLLYWNGLLYQGETVVH